MCGCGEKNMTVQSVKQATLTASGNADTVTTTETPKTPASELRKVQPTASR